MKPLGKGLGFRLFAVGIVQLFLVACAAWLIGYVVSRLDERGDPRLVASKLKPVLGDHADQGAVVGARGVRRQHQRREGEAGGRGRTAAG